MDNKNLRPLAATGLALLTLAGCTSLEYVPVNRAKPEELQSRLSVGENVVVRTVNGEKHEFRITSLEADAIVGKRERVAYQDIDLVDVNYVDYKGTAQATGAVVLLAAVLVLELESEDEYVSDAPCRTDGNGGMICKPK